MERDYFPVGQERHNRIIIGGKRGRKSVPRKKKILREKEDPVGGRFSGGGWEANGHHGVISIRTGNLTGLTQHTQQRRHKAPAIQSPCMASPHHRITASPHHGVIASPHQYSVNPYLIVVGWVSILTYTTNRTFDSPARPSRYRRDINHPPRQCSILLPLLHIE